MLSYEQVREAGAVQDIDRTRPVWHWRQIVALGDLCLDLDYDVTYRHRDLMAGGTAIERAYFATGILPHSPEWLHRLHPAIFRSPQAAERALKNYLGFSGRILLWESEGVFVRRPGARRPLMQVTLDRGRHPDAEAALTAAFGPGTRVYATAEEAAPAAAPAPPRPPPDAEVPARQGGLHPDGSGDGGPPIWIAPWHLPDPGEGRARDPPDG
jgi:hypothetical protein